MGGKSKRTTVGYWYCPAWHAGLSKGPVDAFLEFRGGDKPAWQGELTTSGTISINAPMLWGGEKDQGGIVGDADVMFGESTQVPNAYLLSTFGPQVPAWRGFLTFVFKGGKYGAMNPYPQRASYKFRKILAGWDNDTPWYPEKAEVFLPARTTSVTVWEETFADGLTPYAAVQGSTAAFSVAGSTITALTAPPGVHRIARSLPIAGAAQFRALSFRFKLHNAGGGNSGIVQIFDEVGEYVHGFNPRWPSAGNQPIVGYNSDEQFSAAIGTSPLPTGKWFRYEATYDEVALMLHCAIYDEATGALWGETSLAGGSRPVRQLRFWASGDLVEVSAVRITHASTSIVAMNPAHVLYFARTNSEMGREPVANINDASMRAAADILHAEGFGICTERDPSTESVEDFEKRICKLIGGSFTRSVVDGKWHLNLARGNYDLGSLPVLTDDDILDFREIPSTLSNVINSVSVRYFDPETKERVATPPVRALALVADHGTIHQTYDYPEIPVGPLAARVGLRELQSTATPTRAFELTTTRATLGWLPDTYFRLRSPKRGIADMVCVVGDMSTGTLKSGAIRMKAVQDIYSLPATSYVEVEPGVDTRPSPIPVRINFQRAFEAPYIEVVTALSRADLAALPADVGYLMATAAEPARSRDYTLAVAAAGGDYVETANGDWTATAVVVQASGFVDTAFTLANVQRLDEVEVGMPALWGDELVRVDAINRETLAVTFGRSCGDTVPARHPAGTRVWFYSTAAAADPNEYTDGEIVQVKLLTNTGSQQLPVDMATAIPVTFDGRAARPYPPGRLRINGEVDPSTIVGSITVTGVHRDRVLQADQLVDGEMSGIGPEPGTTYTVRYFLNGALVHTDAGLVEVASTYAPTGGGLVRIEVESVRDGLVSYQRHVREFAFGSPLMDETGALITTEDAQPILME